MELNLSKVIDITSYTAKYDEAVKELLADKQVLARILKYSLEEFYELELSEIMENMSEPEISKIMMEPGQTNAGKVEKLSEEDNVIGEGKIYYDIRFVCYLGEEMIKFIINVEAQKTTKPEKLGYHLDNRIIYYMSRMVSAQKEVEFTHSDYDGIKAVRSIWICMDSKTDEDSINKLRLVQENIYGKPMKLDNLDKFQGVIIRLRKDENAEASNNYLISMLEELLKKEEPEKKKKNLTESYGFEMNDKTGRRINTMCNLSEVLLERGIEQGIERGIEQGIERGRAEGLEAGLEQGIELGRVEERAEGLRRMIETVRTLVGDDFIKVCEIVRRNDVYANVSDEEIGKYW